METLLPILQGCLSHDSERVKEAGAVLKQLEPTPGFGVTLLRMAAEPQLDGGVRQVAAINFKNFVKRSWEATPPRYQEQAQQQFVISNEDKELIRANLLEALIRSPHQVQVQLAEVFKTVVYADYPQAWPSLLQDLYQCLSSQDQARLHGGLLALRILTRKYEFRDDEEREPLKGIVEAMFPLLLHIFQQLLAAPVNSPQVPEYLKLVCKTFWSATYMGIPALLTQQDVFVGWMTCLGTALTQPLPAEVQALPVDERHQSPWWKAKKWVLHITYRLFNRYAVPKLCRSETDTRFSEMYSKEVMTHFMDAHLGLVAQLAAGQYFSPRVVNMLLQYLQHAVGIPSMYKHLKAHWDNILHNVAFPLMCFSDEDASLWADDPQEYIRKGYDILEDMYSPKTAAANFAHELCEKRKPHLDTFMALLAGVMAEFSRAGAQADIALARRMDGALLAVGCMTHILRGKKPYKEQLGGMMAQYVVPCFTSPYGHLRSKAVWVAGVYCCIKFPDGKGQGPTFMRFLQQVVSCLGDPELPVRVDAVVALRHFLEEAEDTEPIAPLLPQLLTSIFGLMDQVDNEDLVFTLEALVEKFDAAIAPYALDMARSLSAAFARYSAAADDDGDDDETAGIAAFGCMRALNTLLESVAARPEMYAPLEEVLMPIMQRMISTEGQDIFEEALEMLSYFTYYSPSISERLWSLWPQLQACLMEWAVDYWENILVPLDNFISRGRDRYLGSINPDYQTSVYTMVQHSLTADLEERSVVPAAKLLEVVLQNCRGLVDRWLAPYLALVLGKVHTATNRTLKDTLMVVVANCLYYNPVLAFSVLQQSGAVAPLFSLWFSMIFANKKHGNKMKHFRRKHDKKMCVLGLTSILACPEEALPAELKAGLAQVLAGLVRLLEALKAQQEEEEALQSDDDEGEDDDKVDDDGADDDGEEDDEVSPEELAKLQRKARDLLEGDEDDSDDEFTDDEEVLTPVDDVDPFVVFAEALVGLQQQQPQRYAGIMAALAASGQDPAAAQAALTGIVAHAEKLKLEQLAAAQRRQQ